MGVGGVKLRPCQLPCRRCLGWGRHGGTQGQQDFHGAQEKGQQGVVGGFVVQLGVAVPDGTVQFVDGAQCFKNHVVFGHALPGKERGRALVPGLGVDTILSFGGGGGGGNGGGGSLPLGAATDGGGGLFGLPWTMAATATAARTTFGVGQAGKDCQTGIRVLISHLIVLARACMEIFNVLECGGHSYRVVRFGCTWHRASGGEERTCNSNTSLAGMVMVGVTVVLANISLSFSVRPSVPNVWTFCKETVISSWFMALNIPS